MGKHTLSALHRVLIFGLLIASANNALASFPEPESTIYLSARAFVFTPVMAASSFSSDWGRHYYGGTQAFGFINTESGAQLSRMGLAYFQREHYLLSFDSETARLYYQTENKLPLSTDNPYPVNIRFQHFAYQGLKLFFLPVRTKDLSVKASLNLIKPTSLLDGTLTGNVQANSSTDQDYVNMKIDYFYSRDLLFDRLTDKAEGSGYSMDFDVHWQVNQQLSLQWQASDVFGFIDWRKAPKTVATVNSNNKHYDQNGYAVIDPTLSGYDRTEPFHQRLLAVHDMTAYLTVSDQTRIITEVLVTPAGHFPNLGVQQLVGSVRAGIRAGLKTNTLSVSIENAWLQLHAGSDAINLHHARTIDLGGAVRYPF